jgi:hypothetical protein
VPAMMTHRMRIRRQLRSARVAAMTTEERREALLAAERAIAQTGAPPEAGADAERGPSPEPHAGTP